MKSQKRNGFPTLLPHGSAATFPMPHYRGVKVVNALSALLWQNGFPKSVCVSYHVRFSHVKSCQVVRDSTVAGYAVQGGITTNFTAVFFVRLNTTVQTFLYSCSPTLSHQPYQISSDLFCSLFKGSLMLFHSGTQTKTETFT